MPDATELANDAAKAEAKAKKPLPELQSPMTRLPDEIRKIIAKWCANNNTSFSRKTVLFWIDFLKSAKLIPVDLKIDLEPKRGGYSFREKETTYQNKIAELEKALAAAKAGKK